MPRGGRRPNAGRKPDPATLEFRAFWRTWFESGEGRAHLLRRAKASDAILSKLLDKVWPSPQAVKLDTEEPKTLRIVLGTKDGDLNLGYKPMGRIPGIPDIDPSGNEVG